jgi:hypothetical protein
MLRPIRLAWILETNKKTLKMLRLTVHSSQRTRYLFFRTYTTNISQKDINEVDNLLVHYSLLSRSERLGALRILGKDNEEKVKLFKNALEKSFEKLSKPPTSIEEVINLKKNEYYRSVESLKQTIVHESSYNEITSNLVHAVHDSVASFLKSQSVAQWLNANEGNSDHEKYTQILEQALGLSLKQLVELHNNVSNGNLISRNDKQLRIIVNLCANALRECEREFDNVFPSTDSQAAQKVAVSNYLWKKQKDLRGKQYEVEDQNANITSSLKNP